MILALLGLITSAAPLLEETIVVEPGAWRSLALALRQRPAVVECSYQVVRGPAVRVWLLEIRELERFRRGRSVRPLAVSPHHKQGSLREALGIGQFALVVDNRLNARENVEVTLRVTLNFDAWEARELPPERRALVVALSLLFFVAVVWWVARRLGPKLASRFLE
jgi:hypothetical protein